MYDIRIGIRMYSRNNSGISFGYFGFTIMHSAYALLAVAAPCYNREHTFCLIV